MKKLICGGTFIVFFVLLLPVFYMLLSPFIAGQPENGAIDFDFVKKIFSEPRYLALLKNTLVIAVISSVGAMLLGTLVALILNRTKIPFKSAIESLCLFPLLIPQYFTAIAWIYLLGRNGILTNFLKEILQADSLPFVIYGIPGVIFVMILSYFPLVTLLVLSGLKNIDFNLEKAGWLFCSRTRSFMGITLPMIAPYILSGGILVFVLALNNFDVPSILLVNVYSLEIFYQFSVFYYPARAMALLLPLLTVTLVIMYIWYRLFKNKPLTGIGSRGQSEPGRQTEAGIVLTILGGFTLALLLTLTIFLPLGIFIKQAGSFQAFSEVIPVAGRQILNSLSLAGLTTLVVLIIGISLGWQMERTDLKIKGLIFILMILAVVLPGAVLGIGLIKFYNRAGLLFIYNSIFIAVIGLSVRVLIIPVLTFSGILKSLDPSLENSAQVAGISRRKIFTGIILPLSGRAILSAGILCFVLTLGELSISILVNPPGFTTFPIRIYSLFHFNQEPYVAALCLIMAGLIIILYIIFLVLWKSSLKTSPNTTAV